MKQFVQPLSRRQNQSLQELIMATNCLAEFARACLDAANAEYDFLIEYFRLQRISGNFDLLVSPEDRNKMRSGLASRLRHK